MATSDQAQLGRNRRHVGLQRTLQSRHLPDPGVAVVISSSVDTNCHPRRLAHLGVGNELLAPNDRREATTAAICSRTTDLVRTTVAAMRTGRGKNRIPLSVQDC